MVQLYIKLRLINNLIIEKYFNTIYQLKWIQNLKLDCALKGRSQHGSPEH